MTGLSDSHLISRHLEQAIELCCVTLVTLELIRSRPGDSAGEIMRGESQVRQVIELLRAAMAESRSERGDEPNGLAFGFVLGAVPGWSPRRRR
jgi:hypothetical protein